MKRLLLFFLFLFCVNFSYAGLLLFSYMKNRAILQADSLNKQAKYEIQNGNFDTAIRINREAWGILQKNNREEGIVAQNILGDIVQSYIEIGDYTNASIYEKKRVELSISNLLDEIRTMSNKERILYWKNHAYILEKELPEICYYLFNNSLKSPYDIELSMICELDDSIANKKTQTIPWGNNETLVSEIGDKIINSFDHYDLSGDSERYMAERHISLNKKIITLKNQVLTLSKWDEMEYEIQLNRVRHEREMLTTFYNGVLLRKGFLLNSEIELKRLIMESGDTSVIRMYNELQEVRKKINEFTNGYIEADSITEKYLSDKSQYLDSMLTVKVNEYGNYTLNLRCAWYDVHKQLTPEDIAIEFVRIPIETDCVIYVAMVIRKDARYPQFITLFEEKTLKMLETNNIHLSDTLTKLIWFPLRKELHNKRNIYFSPDGYLHNIAIESQPGMEEYNIYRLSSTRELCGNGNNAKNRQAVLFGGLEYNAKFDEKTAYLENNDDIGKENEVLTNNDLHFSNIRSLRENVDCLADLPEAKREVEQIILIFQNSNTVKTSVTNYTGYKGTEMSFKNLTGQKNDIIHVATHGFYIEKNQYELELLDNESATFENNTNDENNSLNNCGLFFAGANTTILSDTLEKSDNDGILTALEVSNMDLRGLDMLSLSACQTALGNITSDGVYGLQRGFKKAGANSILMSLWKVDDAATCLLMTEFYKNLIGKGKTKHEALEFAKQTVRSHKDKGWDNPEYWAAFILLDGLY